MSLRSRTRDPGHNSHGEHPKQRERLASEKVSHLEQHTKSVPQNAPLRLHKRAEKRTVPMPAKNYSALAGASAAAGAPSAFTIRLVTAARDSPRNSAA